MAVDLSDGDEKTVSVEFEFPVDMAEQLVQDAEKNLQFQPDAWQLRFNLSMESTRKLKNALEEREGGQ